MGGQRGGGRGCPHYLPTLVPKLPPCLGWATVGSELIYCMSDLLNEVQKGRMKFSKTPIQFANNSNKKIFLVFFVKMIEKVSELSRLCQIQQKKQGMCIKGLI